MAEPRVLRMSEVCTHNSASSLWVVIEGNVYDVTHFLSEHPGGQEVLLEQAGRDATVSFIDVGHSSDAKEMTKQYLIGTLASEDRDRGDASNAGSSVAKNAPEAGSWRDIVLSPTWSNWLIPTAIAITVYVLYKGVSRLL